MRNLRSQIWQSDYAYKLDQEIANRRKSNRKHKAKEIFFEFSISPFLQTTSKSKIRIKITDIDDH